MKKLFLFIALSLSITSSYSQGVREIADSMNIRVSGTTQIMSDSMIATQDALILMSDFTEPSYKRCMDTYDAIVGQAEQMYGKPVYINPSNHEEKARFKISDDTYLYIRKTFSDSQCTFLMYTL